MTRIFSSLTACLALIAAACGPAVAPASTSAPVPAAATTAVGAPKPTDAPKPVAAPTTAPTAQPTAASKPTAAVAVASQPKRGGTLKVGMQADPTALDPHKTSLTALFHVTEHIYSSLLRLKPDLTVEGDLAEKWEVSADGKTYTFTLRKGIKFHNGRPLVADDVKYSLERVVDPALASPQAFRLAAMETVETPSDGVVLITLKRPDASFVTNIAHPAIVALPKEEVEKNGDLTKVAVGTGPFKLKEFVPNTRIVLERNPDYWESPKPYLDGIEMSIIPDDTARSAAVRTGTVDLVEYAPLKDIPTLKGDTSLALAGDQNTNIRFIALNVTRKPFDNVKVRQAVSAAIDRTTMTGPTVFGQGIPTVGLFPPGYWAGMEVKITPPDLPKAKQLMAEAGYADGFKATIQSWSQYSFLSNAALVVQEQLRQIGITTDVDLQENAAYIQNFFDNNFDLSVTGTSAYVDPNDIFFSNFQTGQRGNATRYSNPQVDKLILDGIATTDLEARKKIYLEIQQILLDDAPWVNLYIANQFEAMKTYVKGYVHNPAGWNLHFKDVWLDK
jgi:peptide/nickel transport system substrate-binding protein